MSLDFTDMPPQSTFKPDGAIVATVDSGDQKRRQWWQWRFLMMVLVRFNKSPFKPDGAIVATLP